jgi:pyruvate dehydrogenase E2 component (dihydrolipoamide acetyltransferase)
LIEFQMPALGADMDEGRLDEWRIAPGDTVTRGQIVAVVETTKAAVEIECWNDGVVDRLLVPVGETVAVGTPLATLAEPGDQPDSAAPKAARRGRRRTCGASAVGFPGRPADRRRSRRRPQIGHRDRPAGRCHIARRRTGRRDRPS